MPAKGKGNWIKKPKIKEVLSDDGGLSTGFLTRDDTLTITGKGQPGTRIVLFDNGKKIGVATVGDNGKWSIDAGPLGDGAHQFTARAKLAGMASKKSKPVGGEIDATPPAKASMPDLATASDTGASSADNHTADTTPTLTGTAEAGATVTIRDGAAILGAVVADGAGQWSFTAPVLSDGLHTITATATDKAGNVGEASSALVVAIDTAVAGSITLGPVTEDNIINLTEGDACFGNIPITGTVSGDIPDGATVTLVVNGVTYTGTATGGAFTIMVRPVDLTDDGDLTISASVTALDAAGNAAVVTDTQTYTLDTYVPDAPEITGWSEDTDTVGDLITRDNDLILTGTAEAGVTVSFRYEKDNAIIQLGTTVADGNGDWTFQTGELPIGRWRLIAEAFSEGGNGSDTDSIRIAITGNLVYDAAFLTAPLGFFIEGAEPQDRAGFSLSNAGDVNGDGFDDMIVGAFSASDAGEAYVIFGKATAFGTIDPDTGRATLGVGDLDPADGFVIKGATDGDQAGFSVSGAGDVNGDGYDDLIVGAPDAGYPNGKAYVVFGKASGFGTVDVATGRAVIDLGSLASPAGFVISGDAESFAGFSVSGAGDVNGDGFDDLLVGAPAFGVYPAPDGLGKAYVIFGKASGFGPVDLSAPLGSAGFVIEGAVEGDDTAYSLSGAGDLNDDGFADIVIGARFGDSGGEDAGEAYVLFGKATGFGTIDLATLAPANGFVIRGDAAEDRLGDSMSGAGDINGDGFADLIVGATFGDDGGEYSGEAYVFYGKATGFGTVDGSGRAVIDVTNLDPAVGFVIQGAQGEEVGKSVSSAGDVNGDGFDDLIIGAYFSDDGADWAGEAYVVFGKAGGFGELDPATGRMVLDLKTMGPEEGFTIWGDRFDDGAGQSVSSAGDINGDGFDDLMVGAPSAGDTEYDEGPGQAYVMFGRDFRIEIDHLGDANANTLTGTSAAETFVGGGGADTLIGNGGADSFRGGAGNDTINVTDLTFLRVDGGSGSDTLRLAALDSLTLDFSVVSSSRVRSIETITLATGGNDTLKLSALDVLAMSDNVSGGLTTLTVMGGHGDSLATYDSLWMNLGGDADNITLAKGNVRIIVDADIDISGVLLVA